MTETRLPRSATLCALRYMACAASLVVAPADAASAELLLPDLIAWESEELNYMHGGFFDLDTFPSKVLYRFTGALPNIGAGPLEVREFTHPNNTQDVYQRVYDDEGGLTEVLLGSFPNASPTFGHLWLEGIAQYNLRTVTPGDGVGDIVAFMKKTSMALVDGAEYNTMLPNAPPEPVYDSASDEILGVSVGWADLYSSFLPGQWIDATGLPSGEYWLEVIADPDGRIMESDESNNTTRIKLNLSIPQPTQPGDYNHDGYVDAADYAAWRKNDGMPAPYALWRAHFGETFGDASAAFVNATVPEPSLAYSLVVGAAIGICRRRRAKSWAPAGRYQMPHPDKHSRLSGGRAACEIEKAPKRRIDVIRNSGDDRI